MNVYVDSDASTSKLEETRRARELRSSRHYTWSAFILEQRKYELGICVYCTGWNSRSNFPIEVILSLSSYDAFSFCILHNCVACRDSGSCQKNLRLMILDSKCHAALYLSNTFFFCNESGPATLIRIRSSHVASRFYKPLNVRLSDVR